MRRTERTSPLLHRWSWRADELEITDHARDQMAERNITAREVAEALNTCDEHRPGRQKTTIVHVGWAGSRRIAVVTDRIARPPRVVSSYPRP